MRRACKAFAGLSLAISFVLTCAAFASAQNREEHFVSARAGGVNFVSGDVTFSRAGKNAWQQLATTDELKSGDTVRTGADGRAEVLLNPGSYLRLGENSEFELTDAALDTLRLKLVKGSALVEAAGFDGGKFSIVFDTPQTHVSLIRSGIYRLNVASTGATEIVVRKGRALVGGEQSLVKEGVSARVGAGGAVEVAKFDKNEKDALDAWGKRRAEELAQVNRKLQTRALNAAFSRVSWNNFGWGGSNPTGLWLWSAGCYTYLPFFGWTSPYGFFYSTAATGLYDYCGCGNVHGGDIRSSPRNYDRGQNGAVVVTRTPNTTTNPSQGTGANATTTATAPRTFPSQGGGMNNSPSMDNSLPVRVERPGGATTKGTPSRDN